MKYLITGGSGFIGSHLATALLNRGDNVVVLDDLSTGNAKNLQEFSDNTNTSHNDVLLDDTFFLNSLFKWRISLLKLIPSCLTVMLFYFFVQIFSFL